MGGPEAEVDDGAVLVEGENRVGVGVLDVHLQAQVDLVEVALAAGGPAGLLGGREGGQEQGGQNGDDGDDDQQLDEGEGPRPGRRTRCRAGRRTRARRVFDPGPRRPANSPLPAPRGRRAEARQWANKVPHSGGIISFGPEGGDYLVESARERPALPRYYPS